MDMERWLPRRSRRRRLRARFGPRPVGVRGMTPLGVKLRALRAERRMTLSQLANRLGLSPAYLSALEHGHRGAASPGLLLRLDDALGLTWDEAASLRHFAQLSHPRVTVDTAGLSPAKTELANRLARGIGQMTPEAVKAILVLLDADRPPRAPVCEDEERPQAL